MEQPPLGWTTPVEIVKVVDGDTIRVKITKEFDVRLTDDEGTFNTHETYRPKNDEELQKGLAATKFLKTLLFKQVKRIIGRVVNKKIQQDNIILHIPADERGRIKDVFSIGARIVGHLFVDGKDVAETMKQNGYNKED